MAQAIASKTIDIINRAQSLVDRYEIRAINLSTLRNGETPGDLAHALAASAFIDAFKKVNNARFYFEHRVPDSSQRPADILLVSKDTGFVLVEVKGFKLENIQEIVGSVIKGHFYGKANNETDVFAQPEKAMFQFKKHYSQVLDRRGLKIDSPQFSFFVFFPFICESDWNACGYSRCMARDQLFFAEHLRNTDNLRNKVLMHVDQGTRQRGGKRPVTDQQADVLLASLGESSKIFEPHVLEKMERIRQEIPGVVVNSANLEKLDQIRRKTEEMRQQQDLLKQKMAEVQRQNDLEHQKLLAEQKRRQELEKEIKARERDKTGDLELHANRKRLSDLRDEKFRLQATASRVQQVEQEKQKLKSSVAELQSRIDAMQQMEQEIKERDKSLDKKLQENRKLILDLHDEKIRLKMTENRVKQVEQEKQELASNLAALQARIEDMQKAERAVKAAPPASVSAKSLGHQILSYYEIEKALTAEQQEIVDAPLASSPYLIRGVAGSGKSIVLVNHVVKRVVEAYKNYEGSLKFEKPLKIGVVCFNRSLAPFLRETIAGTLETWCKKDEDPGKVASRYVNCQHLNSMLYQLSRQGYCNYKRIDRSGSGTDYGHYLRELQTLRYREPQKYEKMLYDTLYVDESQDLSPEGFQLLLEMLRPNKNDEKNLIIFYDDAQNLYGRKRPVWKDLGIRVDVGRRSRFLSTCYRNTRETLDFAFNMLMGTGNVAAKNSVNMAQFADVANLKQRGLVESEGDNYRVRFSDRTGEPVSVKGFRSREEEKRWLFQRVKELVTREHVLPEDILILYPKKRIYDDLDAAFKNSTVVSGIIRPHEEDKDNFPFSSGYLTVSTIHSAKGLGAPVVFLIGVDQCQNDAPGRAAFYVGATRAKVKLFVTGVTGANTMIEESQYVEHYLSVAE